MEAIELCMNKQQDQSQIMKGKRTKRPRLPSPLRLTMATCSSEEGGIMNNYDMGTTTTSSNDEQLKLRESTEEEEDMANCLMLLAQGHSRKPNIVSENKVYVYQCKTCERCFPSFQALGGHRASHKKPKPNLMNTEAIKVSFGKEEVDGQVGSTSTTLSLYSSGSSSKCKVHECSICGAEFSSGQALGGHMRRHRTFPTNVLKLDLNLPAPDDHDHTHRQSNLSNNLLLFSASSLVDCHY
ncbi:zinc finger protein ZAT5-like [Senna tora]|uniref:Zinc finger protein ZAT5-like n=1 Tax=Senna tora TaxID=362788 RepID=A0A834WDL4_9FABA|nr:zinc finger protein ZAT5-like [Senna tora]